MKTFKSYLPLSVALAQAATLIVALPLLAASDSALSARSQFCANGPTTVVGTRFDHRTINGIPWCRPGTQTYLIIRTGWAAGNSWFLHDLIAAAVEVVGFYMTRDGDRVISSAVATTFETVEGLIMAVSNANNHQMTWGVLKSALAALDDFVNQNGGFVSATFDIFDGQNQVGTGKID